MAQPKYNRVELMAWRLAEYLATHRNEKPLTEQGMMRAIGLTASNYRPYRDGERDELTVTKNPKLMAKESEKWQKQCMTVYRTRRNDLHAYFWFVIMGTMPPEPEMIDIGLLRPEDCTYSEIIQNARMFYTEDVEERLSTSGKVGDIMRAKVVLGWQDEKQVKHTFEMPQELMEERLKMLDG